MFVAMAKEEWFPQFGDVRVGLSVSFLLPLASPDFAMPSVSASSVGLAGRRSGYRCACSTSS